MTYGQAKMIANSPACYDASQWREAATLLAGRLDATIEDINDAADLSARISNPSGVADQEFFDCEEYGAIQRRY